jgi:iron-sulfur cluster assembly protein
MEETIVTKTPEPKELVAITDKAADEILKIRAENNIPETYGLRVGVKGGGCSGFTYILAFDERPREGDNVFEIKGINVFIDPKSLMYVSGTELDFSDGLNGRGFVFNNPQATHTCGCGNSFAV